MESLCLHASCLLLIKEERSEGVNLLSFGEWRWDVVASGRRPGSDHPKSQSSGWTRQLSLSHLTCSLAQIQDCMQRHTEVWRNKAVGWLQFRVWTKCSHGFASLESFELVKNCSDWWNTHRVYVTVICTVVCFDCTETVNPRWWGSNGLTDLQRHRYWHLVGTEIIDKCF